DAAALRGIVAAGGRQALAETLLQPAPEGAGELDGTRRLSQDEPGLRPRQVVEEPATARLHQQRMACELEAPASADRFRRRRPRGTLRGQELSDPTRVEDTLDIAFPGSRRVTQQLARTRLVHDGQLVAKPVDRRPQRLAPGLAPSGGPTGLAATVRLPARDAMHAAPRRPFDDLDLVRRGVRRPERRRPGELYLRIGRE